MCVQLAPSGGSQVQQSGRGRSIKTWAFVHPQHCPVVWSVPPSLLTCHAHIYPSPSWVCHAHALPWLWFSFLVIRATLPTHFVEPCALGRWVWGVAKLLVRPRPPTPSPRNKTLLKLSIYYVCPKAWLQRYNYKKKTTVSLYQYETSSRTNRSWITSCYLFWSST